MLQEGLQYIALPVISIATTAAKNLAQKLTFRRQSSENVRYRVCRKEADLMVCVSAEIPRLHRRRVGGVLERCCNIIRGLLHEA